MRRLRCGPESGEKGAVMVLVAAGLLATMGMAALVIDIGGLLQERRELQNGADSAALSVAHSCGLNDSKCSVDPTVSGATAIASANAGDGTTAVDSIAIDKVNRRVTVKVSTRTRNGGTLLPFNFAGAVSGQKGARAHATAVAAWVPIATGTPIPLALSVCEFKASGFGTATVIFHTGTAGRTTSCPGGPAGQDVPGGFGWLDPTSGCTVTLSANGSVSAKTGVAVPTGCDLTPLLGTTILIPVYDGYVLTGTIATYHIAGFGAFVLTGFRFPSVAAGSPVPCPPSFACVGGNFTHFIQNTGTTGGGDFGVSVIKLVS